MEISEKRNQLGTSSKSRSVRLALVGRIVKKDFAVGKPTFKKKRKRTSFDSTITKCLAADVRSRWLFIQTMIPRILNTMK